MARCGAKNSERDAHRMAQKCRLMLPVRITQALLTSAACVPLILLSSWLEFLLGHNLWHSLSGLSAPNEKRCSAQWESFWQAYRGVCPGHPIFERSDINFGRCAALVLHGDEGRTKKKNAILVISAHGLLGYGSHAAYHGPEEYRKQKLNALGHTMASRWLLGVLPKSYYDDATGDSFFQSFLQVFVKDMLAIWENGIQAASGLKYHFVICNTIGDWPFLQKAFCLKRCFANVSKQASSRQAPKGICHVCRADQVGFPWEDFHSSSPRWRSTVNTENPFNGSPALMDLPHDRSDPSGFLGQDVFHAWHLGAAKQFLGSCLVLLSETYPGTSIPCRFEHMASDFFAWCRVHKEIPYIRKLTRETVGWPSAADYPCASWNKGSTSTCVLRWFLMTCRSRSHLIEENSLLRLAFCAAKEISLFLSKSFREDVWVAREKAIEIANHGFAFLKLHGECAQRAHSLHRPLFLFMPNLHRIHHLVYCLHDDAQRSQKCRNIMIWNCQVEEDYIGRPSRISRRVASQKVILRTLQRALEASHAKFVESGYLILSKRAVCAL